MVYLISFHWVLLKWFHIYLCLFKQSLKIKKQQRLKSYICSNSFKLCFEWFAIFLLCLCPIKLKSYLNNSFTQQWNISDDFKSLSHQSFSLLFIFISNFWLRSNLFSDPNIWKKRNNNLKENDFCTAIIQHFYIFIGSVHFRF